MDKPGWDHAAEMAACLVNLVKETRAEIPIDEVIFRQDLLDKYVRRLAAHTPIL